MKHLTVDKENKDICYNDKYHIYWDKKDLFTYISVTTLIGLYEQEFDRAFWLQYKAFQRLCRPSSEILVNLRELCVFDRKAIAEMYPVVGTKEFEKVVLELDDEWVNTNKEACDKGTKEHAEQEEKFYNEGYYDLEWQGFDKEKRFFYKPKDYNFYEDIDRQVIPEMLISMKTKSGVRVAGQVDLPVKDMNNVYIIDFKTNKKLKFESYRKPSGEYTMMKEPLSHLMDCNMSHYQMQLSLYTLMIIRKFPFLNPMDGTVIYLSDSGVTRHNLEFRGRDAFNMLCNFRDFHNDYEYKKIVKDEQGRYWLPG